MVSTGLLDNIFDSVSLLALGRKDLATDGLEHEGRLNYEDGISAARAAFKAAQATADCETLILIEETFLRQELQFCDTADTITLSSLTQAIQSFDDALRSLAVVENPEAYQQAEKTYPMLKNRTHGYPFDAFHYACKAHLARLNNVLRAPGINMIEKAVLQQRSANMKTAINSYIKKQKAALEG